MDDLVGWGLKNVYGREDENREEEGSGAKERSGCVFQQDCSFGWKDPQ